MSESEHDAVTGIAVIGMAARLPGARNLVELWRNLRDGVESITFAGDEELLAAGVDPALLADSRYVRARGTIEGAELFDPGFFGFTPREAELMDPQHRILLECAWEALEDAGYDSGRSGGRVAVVAGSGTSGYLMANLLPHRELLAKVGLLQAMVLNDRDFLATRVAYKLDLRGPSLLVQTACSTSLVAVHLACQSLLAGESDMALAGGVSIGMPLKGGYLYQEGGILSPDGHCRSFDARAAGSVNGDGAGVVVLKRLADALADGDEVRAVIRASAVNNDGSAKVGYTAPGVGGQAEVIAEALLLSGVDPDSIGYVEAHGSATPLGDPVEIEALTRAFVGAGSRRLGACAVGSIKSNVGHLNAAAGIAGLIKTVLALAHRTIPPSLHFERPNPQIDFAASPFHVPTAAEAWAVGEEPRRAGVSSFGLGGTNAHLVLEEAPPPLPGSPSRPWRLLLLSARSRTALDAAGAGLAARLESGEELDLADVAHTLHAGRRPFAERRAVLCRDREEAARALWELDPARVASGRRESGERPVVFLFPGLGDHYAGMARELYAGEPDFAAALDRVAELARPELGLDLREVIFPPVEAAPDSPPPGGGAGPGEGPDLRALLRRDSPPPGEADLRLRRTALAQPALFAVELALAQTLIGWGIRPRAMIGYSLGEYVAACVAGALSLPDAVSLVVRRARRIEELPGGAMLAVPLPAAETEALLGEELSLAATNGPHFSVASGPRAAVEALAAELARRGVDCLELATTHAFHSRMMEPAAAEVAALGREIAVGVPEIPYLSNVTGTWIGPDDLADPAYWARHMGGTVRFAEGLAELLADPDRVFLEVGPGTTLGTLVKQHPAASGETPTFATLKRAGETGSDAALLAATLGRLWVAGVPFDAAGYYAHERRRRVPLPTYPFERVRCWIDPPAGGAGTDQPAVDAAVGAATPAASDAAGKRTDVADWFYLPGWRQSVPPALDAAPANGAPAPGMPATGPWLVFSDGSTLAGRVTSLLRAAGREVVTVVAEGSGADPVAADEVLAPRREAYAELLVRLGATGRAPRQVLHLWTLAPLGEAPGATHDRGLLSLLFLAQALSEGGGGSEPVGLTVVASRLAQVADGEPIEPEKAPLLAALKVIPQELPRVACRGVDVVPPPPGSAAEERLAAHLLAETPSPGGPVLVAYRGRQRRVRAWDAVRLPAAPPRLGEGRVYLITDAASGVGPALAAALAARGARLALLLPPGFPPRADWAGIAGGAEAPAAARLAAAASASPELWSAEVGLTDRAGLAAALAAAREHFGRLDGVFHTSASAAGGLLQLKTREGLLADLAPQVEGGRTLLELLAAGEPPDFVALCSSTLAVTGGFGQLEIAAAGAFLDGLAAAAAGAPAPPPALVALHWDPYQWDGWLAAGAGQVTGVAQAAVGQNLEAHAVPSAESLDALERALASGLARVVVSARDLGALIRETDSFNATTFMAQMDWARGAGGVHERTLATPFVAPRDPLEEQIAGVWRELFGLDRVGVDDNFLELGGHSLLAIQVMTQMRSRLGVDLPVTALFEAPTVAELARRVEATGGGAEEDEAALEALLAAVEELSPEEAARRMAEETAAEAER